MAASQGEAVMSLRVTLVDTQDLHSDVVRAASPFCGIHQGVANFSCGLPGDGALNLAFSEQTPQTIGAEHQHISRFKGARVWRASGSDTGTGTQRGGEDMALGMRFG